jgi:hypothetical protein
MKFNSEQHEAQFDRAADEWIRRYRNPGVEDLAAILQRAHENLNGAFPAVSAFERAYRELVAEGEVAICDQKYTEPVRRDVTKTSRTSHLERSSRIGRSDSG